MVPKTITSGDLGAGFKRVNHSCICCPRGRNHHEGNTTACTICLHGSGKGVQAHPANSVSRYQACCIAPDVVPDTTVWILPSAELYLLAVLNSPLYGWYARRRFPPALNGSVRPKLAYIRHLPIATPSPTQRAEIEQLVAQRIVRYADAVGRENVIAGTDCGFAQGPFMRRVHPSIMWAKLRSLSEGARLASTELWGKRSAA